MYRQIDYKLSEIIANGVPTVTDVKKAHSALYARERFKSVHADVLKVAIMTGSPEIVSTVLTFGIVNGVQHDTMQFAFVTDASDIILNELDRAFAHPLKSRALVDKLVGSQYPFRNYAPTADQAIARFRRACNRYNTTPTVECHSSIYAIQNFEIFGLWVEEIVRVLGPHKIPSHVVSSIFVQFNDDWERRIEKLLCCGCEFDVEQMAKK